MILFCPRCGTEIQIENVSEGKKINCHSCGVDLFVQKDDYLRQEFYWLKAEYPMEDSSDDDEDK